jgi:hypothetical protein
MRGFYTFEINEKNRMYVSVRKHSFAKGKNNILLLFIKKSGKEKI